MIQRTSFPSTPSLRLQLAAANLLLDDLIPALSTLQTGVSLFVDDAVFEPEFDAVLSELVRLQEYIRQSMRLARPRLSCRAADDVQRERRSSHV